jgi:NADH dehydrogenase (ubiquinone) Fe-S protein 3
VDSYASLQPELHKYGAYLVSCLPAHIQQYSVYKDELVLYADPKDVLQVLHFLRDHSQCQYKQISDITAVDFPTKGKRFEVVYNLLSHKHNSRIRVKTYADEVSPVPSAVPLFPGADWYEREVYDMFGVFFKDHPDL